MTIQAIDAASVHRLTSGQVITDLTSVVKELLENSLDAGATTVDIRFKEYGLDSIEVQDNGRGIDEADWPGIALKHHTSKLASFEGLTQVDTLGFRGEALSSLCALANVTIVTATAKTKPVGTTLEFSRSGSCLVGKRVARPQGTSVIIKSLFETLPVRRKELTKHAKREFFKALELINAYALVSAGVRFEVKNSLKGRSHVHLQTQPNGDIKSHFTAIFGAKDLATLTDLDLTLSVEPGRRTVKLAADGVKPDHTTIKVAGLISRPVAGAGRSSASRQYFYINKRPFFSKAIAKAFNDVYKAYLPGSYPAIIADFRIQSDAYDVNVSPDKRTILLHSEENLVGALKDALELLFSPSNQTFAMVPISSKRTQSAGSAKAAPASQKSSSPPRSPDAASARRDQDDNANAVDEEQVRARKRRRTASIDSDRIDDDDIVMPPERSPSHLGSRYIAELDGDLDSQSEDEDESIARRPSQQASSLTRSPSLSLPPDKDRQDSDDDEEDDGSEPIKVSKKTLKQRTLASTSAAWSHVTTTSRHASSVSSAPKARNDTLQDAKLMIRKFVNPTQPQPELEPEDIEEPEEEIERYDGDDSMQSVDLVLGRETPVVEGEGDDITEDSVEIGDKIVGLDLPDDVEDFVIYSSPAAPEEELAGAQAMQDVDVDFDLDRIVSAWRKPLDTTTIAGSQAMSATNEALEEAGVEQAPEKAEEALSRIVSKGDFAAMQIIGQFNLGFIIARRKTGQSDGQEMQDDLFIVDQHASDEKYNFEKLQLETVIKSQRLLIPRTLNLPSHEELVAMDNLDTLRFNGFEVAIDEDLPIGHRVKLLAQPVSKSTEFGPQDLEELLHLIASSGSTTSKTVRPSKVRRMFASRACRKSIMIGRALTSSQMGNIVKHMGEMSEPWSCPHGRPTMRWLASLASSPARPDGRADLYTIIAAFK